MIDSSNDKQESGDSPVSEMEGEGVRESLGDLLRKAREDKGLDVREAAEALKISADFMRALESDRYDMLPGETFARGYLKGCSRLLGLDEKDVLARFSAINMAGSDRDPPDVQILHDPVVHRHNRRALVMFAAISLILLIVAASGIYWWQGNQASEVPPFAGVPGSGSTASVMAGPASNDEQAATGDEQAATAQFKPPVRIVVPLSSPVDAHRLVIHVSAECWVEIKDAAGQVHLANLVKAGSEVSMVVPDEPVSVFFGDVLAVRDVHFNGKPVTLEAPSGKMAGQLELSSSAGSSVKP